MIDLPDHEIQTAAERLRRDFPAGQMLDHAQVAFSVADPALPDCPLIYTNRAFEQLTGYTNKEVMGLNCRFLQGEDTDPLIIKAMRAQIREGRSARHILKNYRKNGDAFWNELSISFVWNNSGEIQYVIGNQREVPAPDGYASEDTSSGLIIQEIQHRVKNHLAMVVSLIRLQGARPEAELATGYADLARRVENLALLYEEINAKHPASREVDIGMYLRRVAETVLDIGSGQCKLSLKTDCMNVPAPIELAVQSGMIISELMTNALRHAFHGRPAGSISLSVMKAPKKKDALLIVLGDDGIGIQDREKNNEGSGFGSRIIKSMVAGANANLETVTGSTGTTVSITIPMPG